MKPQAPSVGSSSIVTDETENSPYRILTNPKANVGEEEMRIHSRSGQKLRDALDEDIKIKV